ncbi:MAG: ABC transporter permease [Chloroflexota bacterium]|nr:ABC transporter permease [Chloroflexota bacterium]
MLTSSIQLRGAWAFIERNFRATRRYWGWEVVFLVYSIVNVLAVTYIAPGTEALTGVGATTDFMVIYLLVGTLVWTYLNGVFDAVAFMISWERWEGTIEYTFMAPIKLVTMLGGSALFSILYGLVRTLIVIGVVSLFFTLNVADTDFLTATIFVLLGSVGFLGIGIMAAALPLLFLERGTQMTIVVQAMLLLVSGIYYPVSILPDWLEPLSWISPATYILEGIRGAMLDGKSVFDMSAELWKLLAVSLISLPLGVWIFQKAVDYAKRTGRLKRYG